MTMVGLFYCEKSTSDLSIYNTLCQELATVTMVIGVLDTYLPTLLLTGGSSSTCDGNRIQLLSTAAIYLSSRRLNRDRDARG